MQLNNITKDGFGVLQDALKSGNPENVRQIVELLMSDRSLFLRHINNKAKNDFNILHQAALSCDSKTFLFLAEVITNALGEVDAANTIRRLANQKTRFGHLPSPKSKQADGALIEKFLRKYRIPPPSASSSSAGVGGHASRGGYFSAWPYRRGAAKYPAQHKSERGSFYSKSDAADMLSTFTRKKR